MTEQENSAPKEKVFPTGIPRFIYIIPFYVASFLLVGLGSLSIANLEKDTSALNNAVFAVLLSISAITFSWARLMEDLEQRRRFIWVGERILYGSILILTVSVVKYFVFQIYKNGMVIPGTTTDTVLVVVIAVPLGIVFFGAGIFAIRGIEIIYHYLLDHIDDYSDWDKLGR